MHPAGLDHPAELSPQLHFIIYFIMLMESLVVFQQVVLLPTYATSSDQRLKENIADADDAGSKIDAIQVRKFDWKADGSHQDYGMVAQELLEVAPEAVSAAEDSEENDGR